MKLLILTEYFLPISGGVQTIVLELARGLADRPGEAADRDGIEVIVATNTPGSKEEDARFPFRVVRRPSLGELVRLMRGADVIHLAGPLFIPMALGALLRKPVVVEHHGYVPVCPKGNLLFGPEESVCPGYFMAREYAKCVECEAWNLGLWKSLRNLTLTFPRRWLCEHVKANIAVTEHVAQRLALPRTRTIYHGISDRGPSTQTTRAPAKGGLQIGYIGRLVTEKGIPLLVDAAKKLADDGREFHLSIVGDGPERANLESLVRRHHLEIQVTFLGELKAGALEEAVRSIRVLVLPSQVEETAGLTAIEQMMRGGLLIAADIGGLKEVVGEAGLKFRAGDSEALHQCLLQVFDDPGLIEKLGHAARERAVQLFNRESMIQEHARLYREAMRS